MAFLKTLEPNILRTKADRDKLISQPYSETNKNIDKVI